jgi:hypothetical protein
MIVRDEMSKQQDRKLLFWMAILAWGYGLNGMHFLAGLFNGRLTGFVLSFILLLMILGLWVVYMRDGLQIGFKRTLIKLSYIAIISGISLFLWMESGPSINAYCHGLRYWAKRAVNYDEVLDWQKNTVVSGNDRVYFLAHPKKSNEMPLALLPETLQRFTDGVISYSPEDQVVWITWGGGFGHWGLVIGHNLQNNNDKRLKINEVAYLWGETQ